MLYSVLVQIDHRLNAVLTSEIFYSVFMCAHTNTYPIFITEKGMNDRSYSRHCNTFVRSVDGFPQPSLSRFFDGEELRDMLFFGKLSQFIYDACKSNAEIELFFQEIHDATLLH